MKTNDTMSSKLFASLKDGHNRQGIRGSSRTDSQAFEIQLGFTRHVIAVPMLIFSDI